MGLWVSLWHTRDFKSWKETWKKKSQIIKLIIRHTPLWSQQGHCGSGCSPLSRLAATLLCTAGEVMQHQQQHLRACGHCGTSPSAVAFSLPPSVSFSVGSVDAYIWPCYGAPVFVNVHIQIRVMEGTPWMSNSSTRPSYKHEAGLSGILSLIVKTVNVFTCDFCK